MSIYSTPAVWKPPFGAAPDPKHPFAFGLTNSYALNEGPGSLLAHDAVGQLPLTLSGNLWGSQNGLTPQLTTTSQYIRATFPSRSYLNWPVTIGVAFRCIGAQGNGSTYFGVSYQSSGSSPYYDFAVYFTGTYFTIRWANGTTAQILTSTLAPVIGTDYVAFMVVTPTAQALYVNGKSWTATVASANPTYTGTSQLGIGGIAGSTATNNCAYYWANVWNVALSKNVIQAISQNVNTIWQMYQSPALSYLDYLGTSPYTFNASGLPISGAYGGTSAGPSPGVAGMAISGAYGGTGATLIAPLGGMAISGAPGTSTAGPSPGVAGMEISGAPGGAVFPGITSSAAGLAISGAPGTATAGPSPGVAGLAISGGMGSIAETVTVLLAGLGISGELGGATGAEYLGPFYLPYEYTSVPIETGNTNAFGIDPERTTVITVGLTGHD